MRDKTVSPQLERAFVAQDRAACDNRLFGGKRRRSTPNSCLWRYSGCEVLRQKPNVHGASPRAPLERNKRANEGTKDQDVDGSVFARSLHRYTAAQLAYQARRFRAVAMRVGSSPAAEASLCKSLRSEGRGHTFKSCRVSQIYVSGKALGTSKSGVNWFEADCLLSRAEAESRRLALLFGYDWRRPIADVSPLGQTSHVERTPEGLQKWVSRRASRKRLKRSH